MRVRPWAKSLSIAVAVVFTTYGCGSDTYQSDASSDHIDAWAGDAGEVIEPPEIPEPPEPPELPEPPEPPEAPEPPEPPELPEPPEAPEPPEPPELPEPPEVPSPLPPPTSLGEALNTVVQAEVALRQENIQLIAIAERAQMASTQFEQDLALASDTADINVLSTAVVRGLNALTDAAEAVEVGANIVTELAITAGAVHGAAVLLIDLGPAGLPAAEAIVVSGAEAQRLATDAITGLENALTGAEALVEGLEEASEIAETLGAWELAAQISVDIVRAEQIRAGIAHCLTIIEDTAAAVETTNASLEDVMGAF